MHDMRQRFYFARSPVRGELVHLRQALAQVFSRHEYPPVIRRLLGELLAASVLLTATLKLQGRLSLQARGNGALRMIMAECNHHHEVRAIAQLGDQPVCPDDASLRALLGDGLLVITLEPEQGQRYQGIVELAGDTLADSLEGYFAQSEQIPTRLWLAADGDRAGGLLLQALPPGADDEDDPDLWPRLLHLTRTVGTHELTDLPAEDLLYRLYHEESVTLPAAEPVRFACTCSREHTANALLSIGQPECEDIVAEQGSIRLHCQFCHSEYVFSVEDVHALFRPRMH